MIIFMKQYGPVEEVVTICRVYKIWGLSCSYASPHAPLSPKKTQKKQFPRFGFFVKIHLLESSKFNLYDLYFITYSLMILLLETVDCNKNLYVVYMNSVMAHVCNFTYLLFPATPHPPDSNPYPYPCHAPPPILLTPIPPNPPPPSPPPLPLPQIFFLGLD